MTDMSQGLVRMVGRSTIADSLVQHCLRRDTDDVPMILLLGPRGSGKTLLITYLQRRLALSHEMPYVLIDCAERQKITAWRLISNIADGLTNRWQGFGRLEFSRTAVARLAAEHGQLPSDDDQKAKQQLLSVLRTAANFSRRAKTMDEIIHDIAKIMNTPPGVDGIVGKFLKMSAGSEAAVRYFYRRELKYFSERWGAGGDGLTTLIALNRRFHENRPSAEHPPYTREEHLLCQTLLDDLTGEFFQRNHQFNCTVLLDNCDKPGVVNLLNLFTGLRRSADPLFIIAASRSAPKITNLLDSLWSLPCKQEKPMRPCIPDTEGVDYVKWKERHRSQKDSASWWYPIWLRDLTCNELNDVVDYRHVGFVHRLTHGHPWGVREVSRVLPSTDMVRPSHDTQLHDLLVKKIPSYLLEGFRTARPTLVRWSAAQTIETAMQALGHDDHPGLYEELINRLWLVPGRSGRRRREFQLHPWLRRVLLYELAAGEDWKNTHQQLRQYCDQHRGPVEAAYHSLSLDDPGPAVSYLTSIFHIIDADHWIEEFDEITSAPRLLTPRQTAGEQHETMIRKKDEDVLANIVFSMVAARSIWFDPFGDPTYSLKYTIAHGYVRLAEMATAGFFRYRDEVEYYRNLDPQTHTVWRSPRV